MVEKEKDKKTNINGRMSLLLIGRQSFKILCECRSRGGVNLHVLRLTFRCEQKKKMIWVFRCEDTERFCDCKNARSC